MIRLVTTVGLAMVGGLGFVMPALADNTAIDLPEPASLSVFAVAVGAMSLLRRRR